MGKRILLVEDDMYLRDGLSRLLEKEGYEPVCVCGFAQGLQEVQRTAFDLVILDVLLPDGSGFDLCAMLRKRGLDVPVLFLTACDEEFQIVRGLDAGGDDYVAKPFRLLELLSRVRALLRRKGAHSVYQFDDIVVDAGNMTVKKGEQTLFLTPTEFKLLSVLIQNSGVIVTREALLQIIWDCDGNFIDNNTLSVHISRLRSKIGSGHIKTVRSVGYRWEE